MAANFINTGRKIVAIGRNFSDHAKELGNAIPTKPFFFLKPTSSYCPVGNTIQLPDKCDVHHEVELGVLIGKVCRDVHPDTAMTYVAGYTLGIDLTARDLQNEAKKTGMPWTTAKGFDTFTPITNFIPSNRIQDPHNLDMWLKVNNTIKQKGNTGNMIFRIPELISHVSGIMKLEVGDLILTGTPKGVGSLQVGDTVQIGMESLGVELVCAEWQVEARQIISKL